MIKSFADLLGNELANWIYTENGQIARSSTGSHLLDLYGTVGSLRTRPQDVIDMFAAAFKEDALLATKLSFHARNIRGGLGERLVSRAMWRWLAINMPEIMKKNLHLVPAFGRFDDLYAFIETPIEDEVWAFVDSVLKGDYRKAMDGKPVSLLAKWLKSVNASSPKTRALGKYTAMQLGMSERSYRKLLSNLRSYMDNAVVETKMSKNNWSEIDYEKVCSKAMANNRKAFGRHDNERFVAYIAAVEKGEAKINSSTLYPYDILEKMGMIENYEGYTWSRSNDKHPTFSLRTWDSVLEAQWKALPDYVESGDNVLIVADTSGSMAGRPLHTSVGLAVYFADHNKGAFAHKFITFSSVPSFVTIKGATMKEKVACIPAICENTDLNAVFELILSTAVQNNVPQEELPKSIVVISDMEIDHATNDYRSGRKQTFTDLLKQKYAEHGYILPNIVYWCVDSRHNVFHAEMNDEGVQLASGQSPSVFKSILNGVNFSPYDAMVEVLNSEAYECVTI
jgi:hypothetical protein